MRECEVGHKTFDAKTLDDNDLPDEDFLENELSRLYSQQVGDPGDPGPSSASATHRR